VQQIKSLLSETKSSIEYQLRMAQTFSAEKTFGRLTFAQHDEVLGILLFFTNNCKIGGRY
jgi:hypothetical protein